MYSDQIDVEEAKADSGVLSDQDRMNQNSALRAMEKTPRFLKHAKWVTWVIVLCGLVLSAQVLFSHEIPLRTFKAPLTDSAHFPPVYEAPEFPTKLIVFEENPDFAGPPSLETNTAWQSLFPMGRGFVKAHGREKGMVDAQYSIAAFHQYHCLYQMRGLFSVVHLSSRPLTNDELDHVYHCFEYLRQVIVCHADPTMDVFLPLVERPGVIETLGWGNTHVCRDWDALSEWANDRFWGNRSTSHSWRKDAVVF
ncbi:hypothetical protein G7Y89_g13590 [Cudoniella acicularis]|uniref:Oxidase ustYa n=1 Tax=Cudoniella acicularis TaxID=354080 RepID=A0A8H4R9C5_9HELO|nr:hypothetical protein G7Y89_g13590 [Cudoniella acicularis]